MSAHVSIVVAMIVGEDEPLENLAGALENLELELQPETIAIVDTAKKPRLWSSGLFGPWGVTSGTGCHPDAPIPARVGSRFATTIIVGHEPWSDHFARARNLSISLARFGHVDVDALETRTRTRRDWIYFVDCDHRIVHDAGERMRRELAAAKDDEISFFQTHHEALGVPGQWSEDQILLGPGRMGRPWGTFYVARLDRSPVFSNRIHESIEEWWIDEMTHGDPSIWRPDYPLHEPRSVCEVIHYAGTKNFGRRHQRNVRLLELALQDDPAHVRSMGFLACELSDKPGGVARVRELYARAVDVCRKEPIRRGWRSGEFLRIAIQRVRVEAADLKPDAMLEIASDLERFELGEHAARIRETVTARWR